MKRPATAFCAITISIQLLVVCGCACTTLPPPGPGNHHGIALCIGLNRIDPAHYGSSGILFGCENDANDMLAIAKTKGFTGDTILTEKATRAAVLDKIRQAKSALRDGDIFMISYSGHGGQTKDGNGDETDGEDETWCLYDGQLIDDELYAELRAFSEGVRILMFSDSCHSGTVARVLMADFDLPREAPADRGLLNLSATPRASRMSELNARFQKAIDVGGARDVVAVRALDPETVLNTYVTNQAFYDDIQKRVAGDKSPETRGRNEPKILSINACKDDELAGDGSGNGVFTAALCKVWDGGKYEHNYSCFHQDIRDEAKRKRAAQTAQLSNFADDQEFEKKQRPFTINP
jgi:hypothetical protein